MEQSKYTQRVRRNLRAQDRAEQRLAMRADTTGVGVVLLASMLAVTLGASL